MLYYQYFRKYSKVYIVKFSIEKKTLEFMDGHGHISQEQNPCGYLHNEFCNEVLKIEKNDYTTLHYITGDIILH